LLDRIPKHLFPLCTVDGDLKHHREEKKEKEESKVA